MFLVRAFLPSLLVSALCCAVGTAALARPVRFAAAAPAPLSHAQSALGYDALWTTYPLPNVPGNLNAALGYNGGVIVAGFFSDMGTVHVHSVGFWDGSNWHAMGASAPSSVYALALYAGQPVAAGFNGGSGTVVGAGEKPSVFQWNGSDWIAIGSVNGQVNAMAVSGTDLYIGGTFVSVNGVAAARVARWDGANWHAVGTGFTTGDAVNELVVHDGNVIAAGRLTEYLGIAQWNGASWATVGGGLKSGASAATITGLISDGTTLYASGNITASGATTLGPVVAWNGSVWSVLANGTSSAALGLTGGSLVATASTGGAGLRPQVWSGSVWQPFNVFTSGSVSPNAYANSGSLLYAVGSNAGNIGDPVALSGFASFDGASWTQLQQAWSPDMRGLVGAGYCALVYHGSLFVGGTAGYVGAGDHFIFSPGIARWDGDKWNAVSSTGGQHFDLAVWSDSLVASVDGLVRVWNGSTWRKLARSSTSSYTFDTFGNMLAVVQGQLYVVGPTYLADSGVPAYGVLRWNGSDWVTVGGGIDDPNGYAYSATDWGTNLVVGGQFASIGGVAVQNVAYWDGAAYHDLGGGVTGTVYAMASDGSDLVVGGPITAAGGGAASGAARWDGTQWHAMGTRALNVNRFRSHAGHLYAAGDFLDDASVLVHGVALWTGAEWQLLGSGVDRNAYSLEFFGDDLYTVGDFSNASGRPSRSFAKLANVSTLGVTPDGPPSGRLALAPSMNPSRGTVRFAVTLPSAGHVRLVIHDVAGREVARLLDGEHAAGAFSLAWSEPGAPGLYFATLESAGERRTARVVRLQ